MHALRMDFSELRQDSVKVGMHYSLIITGSFDMMIKRLEILCCRDS